MDKRFFHLTRYQEEVRRGYSPIVSQPDSDKLYETMKHKTIHELLGLRDRTYPRTIHSPQQTAARILDLARTLIDNSMERHLIVTIALDQGIIKSRALFREEPRWLNALLLTTVTIITNEFNCFSRRPR